MGKISIDIQGAKVDNEPIHIIGIDLGTSNSLVAYTKDGNAQIIKDKDNNTTLVPSIIHFAHNGDIIVGQEAKSNTSTADRTIFSVKRLMGKSYEDLAKYKKHLSYNIINDKDENKLVKIEIDNKYYTPIELSAHILKQLKASAEKSLNTSIEKAVITVPAYFNDTQRQATRDAGKLAGLDVLRIINEPTAASLAYGIGKDNDNEEKVVVYDLGGGTFDISILHIDDGIFEVLSTHGDSFLGGDDFDNIIVQYWASKNKELSDLIQNNNQVLLDIKYLAEDAKKELTNSDNFITDYKSIILDISKDKFEELIIPLINKTLESCNHALNDAELTLQDIDKIIMVGGSTRVPLVKESVSKFFNKKIYDNINPDEVVALGAAVQADILAGNNKDFLLLDISPLSLGIETMGGLMDVIIPRNTKIPARFARNYTTSIDGQANLKVTVYQGERDLIKDNRKLAEFVLRGIPPMGAGMPKIEIRFMLDVDGILTVRAKELRSDIETQIEIRSSYGISEEEMGKMLLDSIINAKKDMTIKALLEAINEGNHIVQSTLKFIKQNHKIITKEETEILKKLTIELEATIESKDKDSINTAITALNDYSIPLAHRAMDYAVEKSLKGTEIR